MALTKLDKRFLAGATAIILIFLGLSLFVWANFSSAYNTPPDSTLHRLRPKAFTGKRPYRPYTWAEVVAVEDGDTIWAEMPNGRLEEIRMLGVDTPEKEKPGEWQTQPFSGQATRLPRELKEHLVKDVDGRMRFPVHWRVEVYEMIAKWLGRQPALCKETREVWQALGWDWAKCNCQE